MTGRFLAVLFYSSFLLNSFVFVFTKSTLVPRYYITTMVLVIPLVGIYFMEEDRPLDRYLVMFLLAGCLLLATAKTSLSMVVSDKNETKKIVAEELLESGYSFGYATYWNANIIQELSDGRIEVGILNLATEGEPRFFEWSTMKRYYEPGYHTGKVFVLLTEEEARQWKDHAMLQAGEEMDSISGYAIYHYDSNKAFLETLR